MRTHRQPLAASFWMIAALASGCSATPPAEPPATHGTDAPVAQTGYSGIVRGAGDSVVTSGGDGQSPYRYRFRQIDPPSERFTFQDRDLSFFFKPSADALHFQVENRQAAPVWIEWDRCVFYAPDHGTGRAAHGPTRWNGRFTADAPTQILGLQRYGDYVFPMDYLVDPGGSEEQLHRPLFPQDGTAPQYTDSEFGVDLVFRIENRMRTYPFRFRVASVLPR